ncbi:hypothetical protein CEXT_359331, partial [Caerostris extrusa]
MAQALCKHTDMQCDIEAAGTALCSFVRVPSVASMRVCLHLGGNTWLGTGYGPSFSASPGRDPCPGQGSCASLSPCGRRQPSAIVHSSNSTADLSLKVHFPSSQL